jgi:iron(III) transport system substrate-binding protein
MRAAALVALLVLTLACGPAATPTAPAPAPAPAASSASAAATSEDGISSADWQALVRAAEQEGKVVIYGPTRKPERDVITTTFEKAYPRIKVEYFGLGGSESGPRIIAEQQSGVFNADLTIGGLQTPTQVLLPAGALEPIKDLLLLPEVLDQFLWWGGRHAYADAPEQYNFAFLGSAGSAVAYNTRQVNPDELRSYWDLLDPKWTGKLVSWDVRRPGPGSGNLIFFYAAPGLGPDFIRQLYGRPDLVLSTDQRQMVDWLAQGRYPIAVSVGRSNIEQARDQGLPVDLLRRAPKEGADFGGSGGIARLRNAPHPNAQRVFVNWFLSREGQGAYQDIVKSNSLRLDLPKDKLPPGEIPEPGVPYIFTSLPQYSDNDAMRDDIDRILREVMAGR